MLGWMELMGNEDRPLGRMVQQNRKCPTEPHPQAEENGADTSTHWAWARRGPKNNSTELAWSRLMSDWGKCTSGEGETTCTAKGGSGFVWLVQASSWEMFIGPNYCWRMTKRKWKELLSTARRGRPETISCVFGCRFIGYNIRWRWGARGCDTWRGGAGNYC